MCKMGIIIQPCSCWENQMRQHKVPAGVSQICQLLLFCLCVCPYHRSQTLNPSGPAGPVELYQESQVEGA